MSGVIPPLPQYASMAWSLVKKKHRDNFTFTFREIKNRSGETASSLKAGNSKTLTYILIISQFKKLSEVFN
jgi:hypothetical protein